MKTVSDAIAERLTEWGVSRIYGYPGDGINGLVGAIARAGDSFSFVQVRHEEMAAFMACAHAKFTGETGVCLATSGPGAIHLLNGLYDAKMDHMPVVALVGQSATTALGGAYQQEVDLQVLFQDVCRYVYTVASPQAARHVVDRAFRTAKATRSVACVILPKDIQEEKAHEAAHKHDTVHSGTGYEPPSVIPRRNDLEHAAEILNAGSRVAILIGAGAMDASSEVAAVADRLQAGVAKALLGKAALTDDYPWVTGTIGLLGTRPSSDMMRECDTLLMVGTCFPYGEFLPKEGQARAVQVDIDPANVGLRYPTEINLIGDSAATLRLLLPLLDSKADRSWREHIEDNVARWREEEAARAAVPADPLNPQLMFAELSPRLPDRAILTGDAGTATNWYARNVHLRPGMKASLSGGLATMGSAVPYAIAAKFAYPDRVAIALTGDGAMQMNGNAELITAAKYYTRWSDPRLVVMVLNNRDLNQVTWEMRVMEGDPKFNASQDLPDFPYATYAELLGLRGIRVDRPENVGAAWDAALQADRPVVLEAYVDADVSQLPPHISFDQAKNFMLSMRTDPDRAGVIAQSIKSVVSGLTAPAKNGSDPGKIAR